MNIRLLCLGAASLLCAGCANMAREAQRSDGFLDFVVAIAGRPRRDVVPVERFSERTGEIVSAHAEVDHRGGTYVSGILHEGFGYEGVFDAQIDVKVLDSDRQLVTSLTTDSFPRPIPNDYHGIIGPGVVQRPAPLRADSGFDYPSDLPPNLATVPCRSFTMTLSVS